MNPDTSVTWGQPPKITGCTLTIPVVGCGVHVEVKGIENGEGVWRVDRINHGHCENMWCMLNSGEWKQLPKFRWLVNRMIELGWNGPCSGEAYGDFYDKAKADYEKSGRIDYIPSYEI